MSCTTGWMSLKHGDISGSGKAPGYSFDQASKAIVLCVFECETLSVCMCMCVSMYACKPARMKLH